MFVSHSAQPCYEIKPWPNSGSSGMSCIYYAHTACMCVCVLCSAHSSVLNGDEIVSKECTKWECEAGARDERQCEKDNNEKPCVKLNMNDMNRWKKQRKIDRTPPGDTVEIIVERTCYAALNFSFSISQVLKLWPKKMRQNYVMTGLCVYVCVNKVWAWVSRWLFRNRESECKNNLRLNHHRTQHFQYERNMKNISTFSYTSKPNKKNERDKIYVWQRWSYRIISMWRWAKELHITITIIIIVVVIIIYIIYDNIVFIRTFTTFKWGCPRRLLTLLNYDDAVSSWLFPSKPTTFISFYFAFTFTFTRFVVSFFLQFFRIVYLLLATDIPISFPTIYVSHSGCEDGCVTKGDSIFKVSIKIVCFQCIRSIIFIEWLKWCPLFRFAWIENFRIIWNLVAFMRSYCVEATHVHQSHRACIYFVFIFFSSIRFEIIISLTIKWQ